MKTSLWIVIALVSGIVGFLTGYSVSAFSSPGARRPAAHAAEASTHGAEASPPAGYGAQAPPAPAGYGAEAPPAPAARKAEKPASAPAASPQTAAAGY